MDSTEVQVHGRQEQSAYNGHFESTCYHPLLLFNREGDCLAAKLRPGNVHCGELFPRVGFIVTNLGTSSRAVVRFYNKRGTAEQWIKEGKQAVGMTRLSCHRFRANEVRLWLSLIAYNLGNLWRRLALPSPVATWSLTRVQQRLVKTGTVTSAAGVSATRARLGICTIPITPMNAATATVVEIRCGHICTTLRGMTLVRLLRRASQWTELLKCCTTG
jgi:hypothetical protein